MESIDLDTGGMVKDMTQKIILYINWKMEKDI